MLDMKRGANSAAESATKAHQYVNMQCEATASVFTNARRLMYVSSIELDLFGILAQNEFQSKVNVVHLSSILLNIDSCRDENTEEFMPSTLAEIFQFDDMACMLEGKNAAAKIVFCVGNDVFLCNQE